jgi:hypothetical protein
MVEQILEAGLSILIWRDELAVEDAIMLDVLTDPFAQIVTGFSILKRGPARWPGGS